MRQEWTPDELDFLEKNYLKFTNAEIAKRLNHPKTSVDGKAHKLGLRKGDAIYTQLIDVNNIPKEDLAYSAGFIDADGSISIARAKKKTREHQVFFPAVSISNLDRGIADWFGDLFKNRVYPGKASWSKKQLYIVNLNRIKDCYELLKAILPFLKVKRKQAEAVIELCEDKLSKLGREGNRQRQEELLNYVVNLNKNVGDIKQG